MQQVFMFGSELESSLRNLRVVIPMASDVTVS